MPKPYSAAFRLRALDMIHAGNRVDNVAAELGISPACLYRWCKQELIDSGELQESESPQAFELAGALRRIQQLEAENATFRRALISLRRVSVA